MRASGWTKGDRRTVGGRPVALSILMGGLVLVVLASLAPIASAGATSRTDHRGVAAGAPPFKATGYFHIAKRTVARCS